MQNINLDFGYCQMQKDVIETTEQYNDEFRDTTYKVSCAAMAAISFMAIIYLRYEIPAYYYDNFSDQCPVYEVYREDDTVLTHLDPDELSRTLTAYVSIVFLVLSTLFCKPLYKKRCDTQKAKQILTKSITPMALALTNEESSLVQELFPRELRVNIVSLL